MIEVRKDEGRIKISFPYNPNYVTKIKAIKGYRWHPEEKYWSIPYSELERLLSVLKECKRVIEERFREKKCSSRGMYIRSSSDILPKWKDIRSSYIPTNWNDMRSTADIPELGETVALNKSNLIEELR
jgi:hypothetical protein